MELTSQQGQGPGAWALAGCKDAQFARKPECKTQKSVKLA